MNGKRNVSAKMFRKIVQGLSLEAAQKENLDRLFADTRIIRLVTRHKPLRDDEFQMIADWFHFALLSLFETRNFRLDPDWAAKRLKLPVSLARSAFERFERLGILTRNERNELVFTPENYASSDDIPSAAVRQSHRQLLDLSKDSLDSCEVSQRDITSMSMAIDPSKLPEAKKLIRRFREQMSAFLETGQRDEVYALNVQLVPLTELER
jgi:uncharacterized protein (TIGR02147 family)